MTMRAVVERSEPQELDEWGQDGIPNLAQEAGTVPCRAWSKQRTEVLDSGKTAVVEDMRAIVPSTANIKRHDRLTIQDRRGVLLFGGPVAVLTAARKGKSGSSPGHLELILERHAGRLDEP